MLGLLYNVQAIWSVGGEGGGQREGNTMNLSAISWVLLVHNRLVCGGLFYSWDTLSAMFWVYTSNHSVQDFTPLLQRMGPCLQ